MSKPRTIRMDDALWAALEAKIQRRGSSNAAAVIRGLVLDYVAWPDYGCRVCDGRPIATIRTGAGEWRPRFTDGSASLESPEHIECMACEAHVDEIVQDYADRFGWSVTSPL